MTGGPEATTANVWAHEGQGLFRRSRAAGIGPGGRTSSGCTPHRGSGLTGALTSPDALASPVTSPRPVPGRPNNDDAPSSFTRPPRCSIVVVSGGRLQAPERDQVHHGHHPPRDPGAQSGRAAPMSPPATHRRPARSAVQARPRPENAVMQEAGSRAVMTTTGLPFTRRYRRFS